MAKEQITKEQAIRVLTILSDKFTSWNRPEIACALDLIRIAVEIGVDGLGDLGGCGMSQLLTLELSDPHIAMFYNHPVDRTDLSDNWFRVTEGNTTYTYPRHRIRAIEITQQQEAPTDGSIPL